MDAAYFKEILYKTEISSNSPILEQANKHECLYGYAQQNMPELLFRFRKCDERSLDAFYKDQIWVSTAIGMNDGYDARLCFNKQEILA